MKGRVYAINLEIKESTDMLEQAMFQALHVMKELKEDLRYAPAVGGLAFNITINKQLIAEIVYEREKIVNMDFDKVNLKKFVDDSYRFRATHLVADEVQKMHEEFRKIK